MSQNEPVSEFHRIRAERDVTRLEEAEYIFSLIVSEGIGVNNEDRQSAFSDILLLIDQRITELHNRNT